MGQIIAKQLLKIDCYLTRSRSRIGLVFNIGENGVLIIGDPAVGDFYFVTVCIDFDVVLAVVVGVVQSEKFLVGRDFHSGELKGMFCGDFVIANLEGSGNDYTEVCRHTGELGNVRVIMRVFKELKFQFFLLMKN